MTGKGGKAAKVERGTKVEREAKVVEGKEGAEEQGEVHLQVNNTI